MDYEARIVELENEISILELRIDILESNQSNLAKDVHCVDGKTFQLADETQDIWNSILAVARKQLGVKSIK